MSDHDYNPAYAEGKIYDPDMGRMAAPFIVINMAVGMFLFLGCVFALIVYFRWERDTTVDDVILTVESTEIPTLRKTEAGWLQATEKPENGKAININQAMKLTVKELNSK